MVDIFLRQYNVSDSTSAYTAPQKLRSSLGLKLNQDLIKLIEKTWHTGKAKVLEELIDKIKTQYNCESQFGFALAPSNTRIIYDFMLEQIRNAFPNAIDFSDCFQKRNANYNAVNTNTILSDNELRERYAINEECFRSKYNSSLNFIILIDDVYSLGNTFNAMKLLVNEFQTQIEFKTAVILKINE